MAQCYATHAWSGPSLAKLDELSSCLTVTRIRHVLISSKQSLKGKDVVSVYSIWSPQSKDDGEACGGASAM